MNAIERDSRELYYLWDRQRRLAAAQVTCIVAVYWFLRRKRNIGRLMSTSQLKETENQKRKRGNQEAVAATNDRLAENDASLGRFSCINKGDDVQVSFQELNRVMSSQRESKEGKKKKFSQDDENDSCVIKALESVALAIRERNLRDKETQLENYITQSLWNDLKATGVEESSLTDIYLHLTENPQKIVAFIGCPIEARYDLLMRLINK